MSENEKFEVSSEWSAEAQINTDKYNEWYENSLNNNEEFWNEHGKRIDWIKPYTKVAIELNKEIIEKKRIKQLNLKNNDVIEVVHFIGGG